MPSDRSSLQALKNLISDWSVFSDHTGQMFAEIKAVVFRLIYGNELAKMALRRQFIIYNRELVSPNALPTPCSFDPYDSKVPLDPETLIAEKIFHHHQSLFALG
jgi:hypothetical protein